MAGKRPGTFGFNDNVEIGGHKYHLQTSSVPDKQKIRSTLFDMKKGSVIYSTEVPVADDVDNTTLRRMVKTVHARKLSESSRIFEIGKKLADAKGAEAKNRLGLAYTQAKMFDEARQAFEGAIAERRDWSEPYLHLGVLHLLRGRLDEADPHLARALALAPAFADVRYQCAVLAARRGELDASLFHLDEALRRNPAFAAARVLRVSLRLRIARDQARGKASALARACQDALPELSEAVPGGSPYMNPHFTRACFLLQDGRLAEALVELDLVIAIGDAAASARANEGALALLELDAAAPERLPEVELARQIRNLEAQLEEHPAYADLRHQLALARFYLAASTMERAERELETAVGINPSFEKAKENLRRVRGFVDDYRAFLSTLLK